MATGQWSVVLRHVQRLFQGGSVSGLSEGQLLERFASTRDELAFEAILARHGPMVLGVCRGVLNDPADVDDAFQATFLVLVKKAGVLRDADRLAQWLYGVARRVSLRARADATRRKSRERPEVGEAVDPHPTLDADLRELQALIREEVDRLSTVDRMAIVLCYLEGLTHEEAADRLGWPVGTVKGRLSRARDKLRARLTRRGVALPTAVLAPKLAGAISAALPPALIRSTTLAAVQLATGKNLTAGIVSAHAITLMEGALDAMFTTKLKIAATALVATCAVGVPSVLAYQGFPGEGQAGKAQAKAKLSKGAGFAQPGQVPPPDGLDPFADSPRIGESPDEVARISEEALALMEKNVANGRFDTPDQYYTWSKRLVEAKTGLGSPPAGRAEALKAHRDRMEAQLAAARAQKDAARATYLTVLEAQYRLIEAERWLREGRVGGAAAVGSPMPGGRGLAGMALGGPGAGGAGFATGGGGFGAGGGGLGQGLGPLRNTLSLGKNAADDKRNEAIRAKLDEPVSMNFPMPTPLEDVIKYIQQSTQDEAAGFATGLPIYVDPDGLKNVDRDEDVTLSSTVKISLEGVPLRNTLRLVLRQLGLDYRVEGGVVLISDVAEIGVQEIKASHLGGPPKP